MLACKFNHLDLVQELLKAGYNNFKCADPIDKKGNTPLAFVCKNKNDEMIKLFINAGVDLFDSIQEEELQYYDHLLNSYDDKNSILMKALNNGSHKLAKKILNQMTIDLTSPEQQYFLYLASAYCPSSTLEVLLDRAGSPQNALNHTDTEGKTPLHHAVLGVNAEMVHFLLQKKVSIAIRDHQGKTAFDCIQSLENNEDRLKIKTIFRQSKGLFFNRMYGVSDWFNFRTSSKK
jgi:ankyrin repeat protein